MIEMITLLALRSLPRGYRLFLGREVAEVPSANSCAPFSTRLEPSNTNMPTPIRRNGFVARVFPITDIAKILEPVIGWIAVYVVNLIRPIAMNNGPDYAVSQLHSATNRAKAPPSLANGSKSLALGVARIPVPAFPIGGAADRRKHLGCSRPPIQFPGLRLIAEQLATQFWRDIGSVSHARSFRVGSGRRSGCNPFAARVHSKNGGILQRCTCGRRK